MDLTSETLNYSAFDIQCEFFPGDNCMYDFDSKENDKHFPDVNFSTVFESTATDEKFRQSNFFEEDVGSPLFNNYIDHPSKVASTNRQYYAYRTSQSQPSRFESDESSAQSESSSTNQDLSSTNSISRVFVCSYCNKSFTSEKYLSMHVSLHNLPNAGGESNSAQLIVQEFKSQGICPIERTKAKGNNKAASWTCKICLKTFAQNSNYKNHIRTHSNERPFVCNICSIGFKERYHLKKHNLFVHTSEMKEDCKICGKRFKDSTAVRAHERTHSDLRPYVCLRCNKAFKTSECLWHHENRSKACVKNYLKKSPGSDLKIESKKIKVDRQERKESSCEALDKDSQETFPSKSTQNSHKYVKMEQNSSFYSHQTVVSQPCSQHCANSEPLVSENNSMYHNFGMGQNNAYGSAEQVENLNCIQCGKPFESSSSDQVADRPQHCVECNTSFRLKVHLNKGNLHKRMEQLVKLPERNHSDLGPLKCRCGKSFKTRDNLWRHQQRGLCEFSYELSTMQEAGLAGNWQSSDGEYFGAKTDHSSHEQSLIPSQEVITDRSSATNTGQQSREREAASLPRGDSTWKMVGAGSKQVAGAIPTEQHPVIPTAIVVPMKRIPSNMFTQKVISPHKKPVENAFLPPFETFNGTIPTEVLHHTIGIGNTNQQHEGNPYHSKPNFRQKLPDIQCMLQSFPQSYSFQLTNSSSSDFIRQSNVVDSQRNFGSTCYQKQPGFANQVAYTNHPIEDFRYSNQFSISYNF